MSKKRTPHPALAGLRPVRGCPVVGSGLGSATINIPQRDIVVGTEPLDLGEIAGTEPQVETDNRVEAFDGLLESVRVEAAKH